MLTLFVISGAAPRRSKHVTGGRKPVVDTDSEPEHATGRQKGAGGASPKKKGAAANAQSGKLQLPPVRRNIEGLIPIENRKCNVPGCDSSGHLGMVV